MIKINEDKLKDIIRKSIELGQLHFIHPGTNLEEKVQELFDEVYTDVAPLLEELTVIFRSGHGGSLCDFLRYQDVEDIFVMEKHKEIDADVVDSGAVDRLDPASDRYVIWKFSNCGRECFIRFSGRMDSYGEYDFTEWTQVKPIEKQLTVYERA